jgi:hypothetical protein
LVVDDFGVQYFNKADADHLINAIKESYPVKVDWTGSKYVGIDLKWNYDKEEVINTTGVMWVKLWRYL